MQIFLTTSKFCWFEVLQTEMIDPAVNGTLNVLRTCAKVSSVKRVIVTSSTAATLSINPNDVVDETVFTDLSVYLAMKVLKLCSL